MGMTTFRSTGAALLATVFLAAAIDAPAAASGLPVATTNRIEAAATPVAFASIRGDQIPNAGPVDRARSLGRRTTHVRGSFELGAQSDGIDFDADRVVIAAGNRIMVIEPGMLRCNGGEQVCHFADDAQPLVRRLMLRGRGRAWEFDLTVGPEWPRDAKLHLRAGNDIGGIHLGSGQLLTGVAPTRDELRRAAATIGAAGGTLETVDASGVVIRLDVPSGALADDTLLSMVPLTVSPVPGNAAVHPGVSLGPHGLQFAMPVTLTFDFGGLPIPPSTRMFFVTSPLTKLPIGGELFGSSLTASLWHFSEQQPGIGEGALTDVVQWANAALSGGGTLTLSELETLLELAALQQVSGCQGACLDLGQLATRAEESLNALVAQRCDADVASPTSIALQRWIEIETLGQRLGIDTAVVRGCTLRVLNSAVQQAAGLASVNPSDPILARLRDLAQTADLLGFSDTATLTLQALAASLRQLMATAAGLCSGDPDAGTAELQRALAWTPIIVSVDAGLAGELQGAIAACQGGPAPGGLLAVTGVGQRFSDAQSYSQTNPSFRCEEEGPCDWVQDVLQGDTPAPFTLQSPGVTATVWKPTPNIVAVDATFVALPYAGGGLREVFLLLTLKFQQSGPGTIHVQINPLFWQGQPTEGCSTRVSEWVLDYPTEADQAASAIYRIGAHCYRSGSDPVGSGRLLTFTFTPAP
jgi:hypothetical protein